MSEKTSVPNAKSAPASDHLIWVDMEMSGLNPETERILEIAIIVTDAEGVMRAEWRGIKVAGHVDEVLKAVKGLKKAAA